MSLRAFGALFEDIAAREVCSVEVRGRPDIPDGEYRYCEYYCIEPGCDCRMALLVVHPQVRDSWIGATIHYGWESPRFYAKWAACDCVDARSMAGAKLDTFHEQSRYAFLLLGFFREMIQDPIYVRHFRRHYSLFKRAVRAGAFQDG